MKGQVRAAQKMAQEKGQLELELEQPEPKELAKEKKEKKQGATEKVEAKEKEKGRGNAKANRLPRAHQQQAAHPDPAPSLAPVRPSPKATSAVSLPTRLRAVRVPLARPAAAAAPPNLALPLALELERPGQRALVHTHMLPCRAQPPTVFLPVLVGQQVPTVLLALAAMALGTAPTQTADHSELSIRA